MRMTFIALSVAVTMLSSAGIAQAADVARIAPMILTDTQMNTITAGHLPSTFQTIDIPGTTQVFRGPHNGEYLGRKNLITYGWHTCSSFNRCTRARM